MTVNLAEEWTLPATVRATTNLGGSRDVEVDWNRAEVEAITKAGYYVVHGTALGEEIVVNIKASGNFIKDPGFQNQGCTSGNEVTFRDDADYAWKLTTTHGYKVDQGDCWVEMKNEIGDSSNAYLHWYTGSTPLEFTLSQDLGTVPEGEYELGFSSKSSWYQGGGSEAAYDDYKIVLEVNGVATEYDCKQYTGNGGYMDQLVATVTLTEASSVTVKFVVTTSSGGAWGNADDFFFAAVIA